MTNKVISIKKSQLQSIISEEVQRLSKSPSVEITNDIISEINVKLGKISDSLPKFILESRGNKNRANYKDDLTLINEKLDELMAVLTNGGLKNV